MGADDHHEARPGARASAWLSRPVSGAGLLALFAGWLALDQLLLWRFIDIAPPWLFALGLGGGALLIGAIHRLARASLPDPSLGTLLFCLALALLLLALGGEGRFFYANVDWQVRFAVLRDMAVNPWPFVYSVRAVPDVLRAPIGMFLVPALAFKTWGSRAGDLALLAQNALLLGLLLTLASSLFQDRRRQLSALLIFLIFSGMDAIGELIVNGHLPDHLDDWANLQYSSTITLAFWVPQHALAGWAGALAYLLWRTGRLPLAPFLALLPLTALWSPLGLMGTMPFAALAGLRTLMERRLRAQDIALPALATLLCVPTLLYLGAGGEGVGARLLAIPFQQWLIFQLLETAAFLVPLALAARHIRFGRDTFCLMTLWLLAIPFVQIGWSVDFMMRGSIAALAILAVMVADHLAEGRPPRLFLLAALIIGSTTGLAEVRRALTNPPAPQVKCSFFKAWDQNFSMFPKGSYLAPLPDMPRLVAPVRPASIRVREPARCWDRDWGPIGAPDPSSGGKNSVER